MRARVAAFAIALAAAACSEPAPPERPTWDDDVHPILRGNCVHCHGATVAVTAVFPNLRFDVCNKDAPAFATVGAVPVGDVITHLPPILKAIEGVGGARPVMPPPPAHPLSAYEVGVIKNWTANATSDKTAMCRKSTNRPPTAIRLRGPTVTGSDLVLELDIADPDGDAVFGKATSANAKTALIESPGRVTLKLAGATGDKVTLKLTDGHDITAFTF